jgi:hypothetical protein
MLSVLCLLPAFHSKPCSICRMRVIKTANNLPTMFVLERIESDPEYDQLKAELYAFGDYVSMRYHALRPCTLCSIRDANRGACGRAAQARSWPCTRRERAPETTCQGSSANSSESSRCSRGGELGHKCWSLLRAAGRDWVSGCRLSNGGKTACGSCALGSDGDGLVLRGARAGGAAAHRSHTCWCCCCWRRAAGAAAGIGRLSGG